MNPGEFHIVSCCEGSSAWCEFNCVECGYGKSDTGPVMSRVTNLSLRYSSYEEARDAGLRSEHCCTNMMLRSIQKNLQMLVDQNKPKIDDLGLDNS